MADRVRPALHSHARATANGDHLTIAATRHDRGPSGRPGCDARNSTLPSTRHRAPIMPPRHTHGSSVDRGLGKAASFQAHPSGKPGQMSPIRAAVLSAQQSRPLRGGSAVSYRLAGVAYIPRGRLSSSEVKGKATLRLASRSRAAGADAERHTPWRVKGVCFGPWSVGPLG
jgi:hypothetical protein